MYAWHDIVFANEADEWVEKCGEALIEIKYNLLTSLLQEQKVTGESLDVIVARRVSEMEPYLCND